MIAEEPKTAPETMTMLVDTDTVVTFDPATGEVLEIGGAPKGDKTPIEETVEWVGRKRAYALAKVEGLTAERDALLNRIHEQYDPQINRYQSLAEWIVGRYWGFLSDHACKLLEGQKAKSVKVALMTLAFRTKRPSCTITDHDKAAKWCYENNLPVAVKVRESVLVSELDDEAKEALAEAGFAEYDPGGYDVFEVK